MPENQYSDACANWPAMKGLLALAENFEAAFWLRAFRFIAILEAISWAGLITGMVLKYGPVDNPIGVTIFGPIHGGIFVAFLVITGFTALVLRWNFTTTLLGMLSSIPPFFTVVFEMIVKRKGLLELARASK